MIDIGKLYCGTSSMGDSLRYGTSSCEECNGISPHQVHRSASERKPIVVWNITRSCNLNCVHCYSDFPLATQGIELSTEEGISLITDLANFKIPALLFSGGEPLMRKDIFKLIEAASKRGIRAVLSTNGTMIDRSAAQSLKDAGIVYVGISLDGMEQTNDEFRGQKGAFAKAMKGFEHCVAINLRVGLRLTLTKRNFNDIHNIFDFIEKEGINRACFYHLVYSGRGSNLFHDDLTHLQSRMAMDIILARTKDFCNRNKPINILTVDNHADGVYIYLKMINEHNPRAEEVRKLLEWNGGGAYSTGVGIANIDFAGNVHPDQFWQDYTFGNVRERSFADIWMDESDELMKGLKHKAEYLKGRCRVCKHRAMCTGSMRVRAYRVYGDPWAPDPQCYLTDEEIGLTDELKKELKKAGEDYPSFFESTQ